MRLEQIKKEAFRRGIRDFYAYARNQYLQSHGFDEVRTDEEKRPGLEILLGEAANLFGERVGELWNDVRFHLAFRITTLNELASLEYGYDIGKVKMCLREGREMSILPLNVLLGERTMNRFVPALPGLFSRRKQHSLDPYGLFANDSIDALVEAGSEAKPSKPFQIVERGGKRFQRIYLGSRKFDYAVLANVTEFCPIGCAECYKGILTRMGMAALSDISPEYADLRRQLNLQEERGVEQAGLLTQWLNKHPEVNTLIFSGGEPFMYSPKTIGRMLDEVSKAEHLKVVRFCTGSVYLGLFSTITDELIGKLTDFIEQNDGFHGKPRKQLYFNCDVADEHQILAPEARIAAHKLSKAGITMHLQMPLQEGINFYRDDVCRTAKKLVAISEAAYSTGAVPYKAIVNMHSPSFSELTVPIERLSEAIRVFDGHFMTSDMMRWHAYCVLHEQGNFYITPNMAFQKEVDIQGGRVTYFIPSAEDSVHTYEEPLLEGINDKEPKVAIHDASVLARISELRDAYHYLMCGEMDTKEFYRISGIKLSQNEPLVVERK